MNQLNVGSKREVKPPKKGLFIHDDVPKVKLARTFDPTKHSINLLADLDYRKACDIVSAFDGLFPGGENTLTKEGVPDILLEALLNKPDSLEYLLEEKSKEPSYISAQRMIRRVFRSPVLRKFLSGPPLFKWDTDIILARVNRKELGSFDAKAVALFLLAHYKGQIVIPNYGPYALEQHIDLINEGRLAIGVNSLSELPPKLRNAALLIKDKVGHGTTFEDAQTLAAYEGLRPDFMREDNDYNKFLDRVMG